MRFLRAVRWWFFLNVVAIVCGVGAEPIRVIFDTDVGDDCDDAGALALLHALADRGEIQPLAVMISNRSEHAPACADAINAFYGRPDLPLGRVTSTRSTQTNDRYARFIAERFPHDITRPENVPDAVSLYRRILASQPDGSVVLVVVGPATNVSDLLDSPADAISPLSGVELVGRKVAFYSAGGNGRAGLPRGDSGWNYHWDLAAAANELEKMPPHLPFVFAGGSGLVVQTGQGYEAKPEDHIIRACYERFHGRATNLGRHSWDQLRLWYAVGKRDHFTTAPPGDVRLDGTMLVYRPTPNRNRTYAYVTDPARVAQQIEALMLHDPPPRSRP